jgi:transcriptional regulator with XRE-family HTH domain
VSKGDDTPWPDYLMAAMKSAQNITPADLSRLSGVNQSQISRWLRGIGQPSLDNLRKIQPVLRVPMLALLVASGHISKDEARLRDLPKPVAHAARGVLVEGLDKDQEKQLLDYAEFLRSQNPGAKKR